MRTRSQYTKFMDLPIEMKAEVFQYLDKRTRLKVRFTCSKLKCLIDEYTGVVVSLDGRCLADSSPIECGKKRKTVKNEKLKKIDFFQQISIRRAWIQKMNNQNLILRYPGCLQGILIGRGIGKLTITSILNQCKNLNDFQMQSLISERLQSEDFPMEYNLLPKLRTLSFFMDPLNSLPQWDNGAFNVLQLIKRIRSPILNRFYMDSWISESVSVFDTMAVLVPFIIYHASLKTVIIGINHVSRDEPRVNDNVLMQGYIKDFIEPNFRGLALYQKFITLSNLKLIEFQALYPYLKAQQKLEKLTVTNWLGRTQSWTLYVPILDRNAVFLKKVHLSVETNIPFNFKSLTTLHSLVELALFVNGTDLDADIVNGINLNVLPQNIELLILSNILLPTQELSTIPNRLKKLATFAIVQIRGMPSTHAGMRLRTVRQFLKMRSLRALLLCGVWLPTSAERNLMQTVTLLLTGTKEFYLITEQDPALHSYWNLIRTENALNANLSFHLLLPY